MEFSDAARPVPMKVWIWNETGLPLKIVSAVQTNGTTVSTTTEWKNFVFEDVPDSLFEVPHDKLVKH